MSMMPPPLRSDPPDEGIPAADPGAGAPPPATGFGVGGEDPDVVPAENQQPEGIGTAEVPERETPFRSPEPRDIGPTPES